MFPVCRVTEKDVANRFDTYTRTHARTRPWVTRVWQIGFAPTTTTTTTTKSTTSGVVVGSRVWGSHLRTLTPLFSVQLSTHTDTRYSTPTRGQSRNTRNTRENMTARRRRLTSRKTTRHASVTSQSISVRKPIRWRMETIARAKKKVNWRRRRRDGYVEGTHHGHHWIITACEYTIWVWGSKIVIIITIESV